MASDINNKLNKFLHDERINKEYFDDLKNVAEITGFNENIMQWFQYLQSFEVVGWRNKKVTRKLCQILQKDQPIQFYSLFCPSYVKGEGEAGFRTDDVGATTKNGLIRLAEITKRTERLGFRCCAPRAIFFDLALEQPHKTIHMLADLQQNIANFQKYLPNNVNFSLLSDEFPELKDLIGYTGITTDPLPVDETILRRIIERGKKFYQLFGWSEEQIIARSKIIASSEAAVGVFLRHRMPDAIMIYTPTMLERAQVYSGRKQNDPLAIIIPRKDFLV